MPSEHIEEFQTEAEIHERGVDLQAAGWRVNYPDWETDDGEIIHALEVWDPRCDDADADAPERMAGVPRDILYGEVPA